jgi:hypothetical protein
MLKARGRRWPVLLVVGLAHHTRAVGGFANVALVLDSSGREVMRHEKLEPYSMTLPGGPSPEDIVPRESNTVAFPFCQDTSSAGFGFEVRRSVRSEPALRRAPERSSCAGPCFGRLGQAATGAGSSREARYSAGVLQPSDW